MGFFASTLSLGINCRGSLLCGSEGDPTPPIAEFLAALTSGTSPLVPGGPLNDTALYHPSTHIACRAFGSRAVYEGGSGICLFLQGAGVVVGGVNGSLVKDKITELYEHDCEACGSVPLAVNNDPGAMGVLTSNYVENTGGCNGVCGDVRVRAGS